jgi:CHASE1-domain containing sensor protein
MTRRNLNDVFDRAGLFLLRLTLFILLLLGLAKFLWSEAAPFLSEIFRHFQTRQSQANFPDSSGMRNVQAVGTETAYLSQVVRPNLES